MKVNIVNPPKGNTFEYEEKLDQSSYYLKSSTRRMNLYKALACGSVIPSWELSSYMPCAYSPQYISAERKYLPIPILKKEIKKIGIEGKEYKAAGYYIPNNWLEFCLAAIDHAEIL
jgi:hypothetical protein